MPSAKDEPKTVSMVSADGTKVTVEAHLQEKLEGRGFVVQTAKAPAKEPK